MTSPEASGNAPIVLAMRRSAPPERFAAEAMPNDDEAIAPLAVRAASIAWIDRPLGWLFFLATAAIDAVLLANSVDRLVVAGAAVAQISVVSIAALRGRAHRLIRGALVVAALGCAKLLALKGPDEMFAHLVLFAGIQVLLLLGVEAAAAIPRWGRGELRAPRPRFPLIEFFGWTIIVAAASLLLRSGASWDYSPLAVSELCLLAVGPTTAYLTLVVREQTLAQGAILGVVAMSAATSLVHSPHLPVWLVAAGHLSYVLAWIAACRIDRQGLAARELRG